MANFTMFLSDALKKRMKVHSHVRWSSAITLATPFLPHNAGTNSDPICPNAPVTRTFFIFIQLTLKI